MKIWPLRGNPHYIFIFLQKYHNASSVIYGFGKCEPCSSSYPEHTSSSLAVTQWCRSWISSFAEHWCMWYPGEAEILLHNWILIRGVCSEGNSILCLCFGGRSQLVSPELLRDSGLWFGLGSAWCFAQGPSSFALYLHCWPQHLPHSCPALIVFPDSKLCFWHSVSFGLTMC